MYPQESKNAVLKPTTKLVLYTLGFIVFTTIMMIVTNVAISATYNNTYDQGVYLLHWTNAFWFVGMLVCIWGVLANLRLAIDLRAPRLSAWLKKFEHLE